MAYSKNGNAIALSYQVGVVSHDRLRIGALSNDTQDFADVRAQPDKFDAYRFLDSIIGLGFAATSVKGLVPPVYNMVAGGLLVALVFASNFSTTAEGNYDGKSEVCLAALTRDATRAR